VTQEDEATESKRNNKAKQHEASETTKNTSAYSSDRIEELNNKLLECDQEFNHSTAGNH